MNPFVLARLELSSPRPIEQAMAALDELVREGFEAHGHRYRLFGSRRGRYLSMSLGMPLLGGAAPVLRAWLRDDLGGARFEVNVGARLELLLFGAFWLALTVLGGGYQLLLQLQALAAGRASAGEVLAVLPGIGIMVGIVALVLFHFRRRGARDSGLLLGAFRTAIGAAPGGGAASIATPTPY